MNKTERQLTARPEFVGTLERPSTRMHKQMTHLALIWMTCGLFGCAMPGNSKLANHSSAQLEPINRTTGTLTTPSYKITIELRCPEGYVTCNDVKYVGVNRRSGEFLTLTGRTIHTSGADGISPSHFLGYEFNSGRTIYFVGEDGELRVTRGTKVLVQETGVWSL